MGSNPEMLLDKPSRRILSVRYRCLRADLCFYENGTIKRFLTIKSRPMRLSLSMAYRTLWMENFKQHENSDVMLHQTLIELRMFNKAYQVTNEQLAMPKIERKPKIVAKKVISQKKSNVEELPIIETHDEDLSIIESDYGEYLSMTESDGEQQDISDGIDTPMIKAGVIESFGINPRRKLFILLLIEKESTTSRVYTGGNLEQELTRIGAAPGDRIKLQVSIKPPLFEDRGDHLGEEPSAHIYYEIEMENKICIAHTA